LFTYKQYFKRVCIAVYNPDTKLHVSCYKNALTIFIKRTDNLEFIIAVILFLYILPKNVSPKSVDFSNIY